MDDLGVSQYYGDIWTFSLKIDDRICIVTISFHHASKILSFFVISAIPVMGIELSLNWNWLEVQFSFIFKKEVRA